MNGRFSITLRTVNQKFARSTLIIGDSNTKEIDFGAGKGKIGESYPGKRVKSARINNIDPKDCIGYSNIVLACGTNDLRPENLKGGISGTHQLVDILYYKLLQIKKLCPESKIFVMAVLPTRLPKMNHNIMQFNKLLGEMLDTYFCNSVWFLAVSHFLDTKGLLAVNLTRNGDDIHLGSRGLARYVRSIKHWVYIREKHERQRHGRPQAPQVGAGPSAPT